MTIAQRRVRVRLRTVRVMLGIISGISALLVILSLAAYPVSGSYWGDPNHDLANLIALGAAVLLGYIATFMLAPGADRVTVSPQGLTLHYSGLRVRHYDLKSPGTHVVLRAFPRDEGFVGWSPSTIHYIVGGLPYLNPITDEAFEGILAASREFGWTVLRRRAGALTTPYVRITITGGVPTSRATP